MSNAFVRMGYLEDIAYPMAFGLDLLSVAVPGVAQYFVAHLVSQQGASFGNDYYTFAIIGLVCNRILGIGIGGFDRELSSAIDKGRFEYLLAQPVRWRALPFYMAQWVAVSRIMTALMLAVAALFLGAHYKMSALPAAIVVLFVGVVATFAIGVLAGSIKVLSKRSDPILTMYQLAVQVFAGVLYPITLIPGPLRVITYLLPHTYVITAVRRIVMPSGASIAGPSLTTSLLVLAVFAVVMTTFAVWAFGRTLEYGRRTGALLGY